MLFDHDLNFNLQHKNLCRRHFPLFVPLETGKAYSSLKSVLPRIRMLVWVVAWGRLDLSNMVQLVEDSIVRLARLDVGKRRRHLDAVSPT